MGRNPKSEDSLVQTPKHSSPKTRRSLRLLTSNGKSQSDDALTPRSPSYHSLHPTSSESESDTLPSTPVSDNETVDGQIGPRLTKKPSFLRRTSSLFLPGSRQRGMILIGLAILLAMVLVVVQEGGFGTETGRMVRRAKRACDRCEDDDDEDDGPH
ncbi:hypothetical protein BC832DRAFT_551163 [Gaertneriomyces semiglobifer]|nr:hypothetical protein BC832DRAFT_551163 [Gaertneriomyces semiglobifer]